MRAVITRPPLPILTSLRFFAAMEVVMFHVLHTPTSPLKSMTFLYNLTSAGYDAVAFFFVLSGFILTYVYSGYTEQDYLNVTVREFSKARFARISPAYFLGLLLSLPPFLAGVFVFQNVPIGAFIIGLLLVPIYLQAWWPPAALLWNAPAWSLSVECFFYALFFWLARAAKLVSRNYFLLTAYGLVVGITIMRSFILLPLNILNESNFWPHFIGYFPLLHLPQFVFGMALGRIFLFGLPISPRIHVGMLWIGAISLVLIFGYRSQLPWWATDNIVLVPVYGLVIFGAAQAGNAFNVLTFPAMVLMGEASYSIYILHLPLHFWWNKLVQTMPGMSLSRFEIALIYFGLVVVLSVLSFLYIETPLRRRILGHPEHRAA